MKVVQVSESEFSVQGHGVHTAFVETTNALRRQPDIEVVVNSREPADIRHIHTVGMYAWRQLLFGKGKKIISGHIVPDSLVGSLRLAKGWKGMASWYLKYFYNRADAVIAVSDATRDELQRIDALGVGRFVLERPQLRRQRTRPRLQQRRNVDMIGAEPHAVFAQGRTRGLVEILDVVGDLLPVERFLAGLVKTAGDVRREFTRGCVQVLPDPELKVVLIHNVMPFAASAAARVCVAREQCVFTLPSEQPMADAVSATSMSSQ